MPKKSSRSFGRVEPRRIRLTATARRHVRQEEDWWLANRIHSEVFVKEFEEALRTLSWLPGAGSPYPQAGILGVRRLLVRKLACHVYYTFNERTVIVRAFWSARRREGPRLSS